MIVNANRFRSDALVVTTDAVEVVPLPALDADTADDWAYRCLGAAAELSRGPSGAADDPRLPGVAVGRRRQDGHARRGVHRCTRRRVAQDLVVGDGPAATRSAVLDALSAHSHVHFACHGEQNLSTPSDSALHLHDGPLALSDLVALHLRDAGVAVLSACRTAQGGAQLFDEAIHLGAAFQLIGYRDVVATVWPVRDRTSPQIAAAVWRDPEHVADAVHRVVRSLRDRHWRDPTAWACFIHLGR
ncbi:hypothetical protein ALI144C_24495 [Actinosynnema sp. ALI-1.44]|uniref:CHAT domain-containing protein n=1 Tax=Actinosynnema sp. ALI-1.44 TaxID=1933779 RepID=UPI00097C19EE|nr:CHAT domain-containing protein [Actinosynnema sp. ALI-1.44]ONI79892.1 hypothetical protein ALI144C_24495 [Actinosynnema sp. ALI-1.44]